MNLIGKIFSDKRGDPSFTRVAPAVCLVTAGCLWVYGAMHPALISWCQQGIEKLVDFAKYGFLFGKGAEELGGNLGQKLGIAPKDGGSQ